MKIKLKKDAPWESVVSPDGQTIDKINWLDEKTDIRPFIKYIEYLLDDSDIEYNVEMEKLISIAEKNNIYAYMCSKEELIRKLKNNNIKMPKNKIDLTTLSKAELIVIAENKGIATKNLSKSKLIEMINNA